MPARDERARVAEIVRLWEDTDYEIQLRRELVSRRARMRDFRRNLSPAQARAVANWTRTWPGIANPLAIGAGLAGITPDSEIGTELARRDYQNGSTYEQEASLGEQSGGIGQWIKTGARNTMGVLEGIEHEGWRRPWRAWLSALEHGIDEADEEEGLFDRIGRFVAESPTPLGWGANLVEATGALLTGGDAGEAIKEGAIGNTVRSLLAQPSSALATAIESGDLGEGAFGPADAILPQGPTVERARRSLQRQEIFGVQNPTIGRVTASSLNELSKPLAPVAEELERKPSGRNLITGQMASPHRSPDFSAGLIPQGSLAHDVISGTLDFARAVSTVRVAGGGRISPGDPAAAILAGIGDARKARQIMLPAGARPTVMGKAADSFLNSGSGRAVMRRLAETDDVVDLRRILNTNNVTVLRQVADARTPDEVYGVLYDVLGREVRQRPRVLDMRDRVVPDALRDTRMGQFLRRQAAIRPDWVVDVENPNAGFDTIDNFMALTRFSRQKRSEILDSWTRVTPGDYDGAGEVVIGMLDDYGRQLIDEGWNEDIAFTMSRAFTQGFEEARELRRYFASQAAEWHPLARLDANGDPLPSPHIIGEYLNRAIPIPDARMVRNTLSGWRRRFQNMPEGARRLIFEDGNVLRSTTPTALVEPILQHVWKSLVLLRPAIITRIGLEEQGRMTAEGLDSVFQHPLSYIMWSVNRRGATDVIGDELAEAAQLVESLAKRAGGWTGVGARERYARVLAGDFLAATKESPNWGHGWAIEMKQLANDPIARRIAAGSVEEAKEWLWSGDGRRILDRLSREADDLAISRPVADLYVESINARMHYVAGGQFRKRLYGQDRTPDGRFIPVEEDARELTAAQAHERLRMSPSEAARMHYEIVTPGHSDIVDAIATGTYRQVLRSTGKTKTFRLTGNNSVRERRLGTYLRDRIDEGPDTVKVPRINLEDDDTIRQWERVTDWMFHQLMSRPTNRLARSPTFRQMYWRRVEELSPYLSSEARSRAISAARTARLDEGQIRRISGVTPARLRPGEKAMELGDLDYVSKAYALDETRKLLYDLTRRRNFFDAHRLVFPFGDAWAEIMGTWARLGPENPQLIERGRQLFTSAREIGLFQPDPASGLEMFMVPGASDMFGSAVLDQASDEDAMARVRFGGYLSGLNLVGNLVPGVGPIVSVPAARMDWLNHPDMLWWRDKILPFGGKPVDEPADITDVFIPAWADKFFGAFAIGEGGEDLFEAAAVDVARAMAPNGLVDLSDRERTLERAGRGARTIGLIRGIVQALGPTGVVARVEYKDEAGTWWPLQVLTDDYRSMLEATDYDHAAATTEFIAKYGIDPLQFITPKTYEVRPGSETREGAQWEADNAELFDDYPAVAHYFNPFADTGEFDIEVWGSRYDDGQRERYTPAQWLEVEARMRAQLMLAGAEQRAAEAGLDRNQRNQYMRAYRDFVTDELGLSGHFYTWEPIEGVTERPTPEQKMAQAQRAADDPAVQAMPAGEALNLYLNAREAARQKYATELGRPGSAPDGMFTANSGEPMRRYLRDYASWLLAQYPEFAPMYRAVFQNEIEEPVDPIDDTPVPELPTAPPAPETFEDQD